MANLIFIHGRDQQNKVAGDLEKVWTNTFKEGLKANHVNMSVNTKVIFPYYGNLLDQLVKQAALPDTMDKLISKGGRTEEELAFITDYLTEIAENSGVTSEEIDASFTGDVYEKGLMNWGWVQAILSALDKRTNIGIKSIRKHTYDVYMYLTKPGIRNEINKFVLDLIGNEPCVVVGHSLGSVVGYNVLRGNNDLAVQSYITLGSPLGVRAVRDQLLTDGNIRMPRCIKKHWFNAFDDRDIVALNPLTRKYFNIDPEIANKTDVRNHTDNRHGIEGYLNDKDVAKVIFDRLEEIE